MRSDEFDSESEPDGGIKEVHDGSWLVNFMEHDLGYFDLEAPVLEPLENPFRTYVLPM